MLQPNGPLPPEVYWRRRALALAVVVVLVVLLIWLVAALVGGQSERPVQPAAQRQASTSAAPATTTSFTTTTASASTDTAAAETIPPVPPPGPPQPCPDPVAVLAAQPGKPEYRAGSRPVFRLSVTNSGPAACTRDLDAGLQELLVFAADGVTRLWSSNDCYPGDGADPRVLQPGETVTFAVTWSGRSSQPACAGQRVQVGPGDYLVVARLGQLASQPTPFRLTA